jgi:hypothetical protein
MSVNKIAGLKPERLGQSELFQPKRKITIALVLAVISLAVYSPSYNYDFVYDDDAVVKDNRYVQQGLNGLGKIWTTSYFQGYDETMIARAYRPVPLSTLAIEYHFWGLNATVNHISNLIFYSLTAVFLFLFLAKLLREHQSVFPIIVCLLFLLHPIHIEVVGNIKSRDTMLGFLNLIIAYWLLLKYIDNRRLIILVLSLGFYLVALFSKEEVITSLAVIPLMLWFFRKTTLKQIAITSLPYFFAVLAYMAVRSVILGGFNEGVTLTVLDNSLLGAANFSERSASNILVLGHYLLKTVFPHPLISDYSFSTIPLVNWDDWRVYFSLLANLVMLALGVIGLIKRQVYGFGPLYYFCSVSIFTSIVTPNVSAYNDRFIYSPVLGICFLFTWLFLKLLHKSGYADEPQPVKAFLKSNFFLVAVISLIGSASIFKIASHLPVWKNRYALFEHDAKLAPQNARMRKNHGGSLARLALEFQEKDKAKSEEFARKAIVELEASLSIYNRMPTGYIHLGNMYIMLNQYDKAEEMLNVALKLDHDNYYARNSLGNIYYRTGRYKEGIDLFERIEAGQRTKNDYYLLSLLYERYGESAKASYYRQLSGR